MNPASARAEGFRDSKGMDSQACRGERVIPRGAGAFGVRFCGREATMVYQATYARTAEGASIALSDTDWLFEHFAENYPMLSAIGRLFAGDGERAEARADEAIRRAFLRLWKRRASLWRSPHVDVWLVEALRREWMRMLVREGIGRRIPLRRRPAREADAPRPLGGAAYHSLRRHRLLAQVLGEEDAALFHLACIRRCPREEAAGRGATEARIMRCQLRILRRKDLFFPMMVALLGEL